jgi:sarcosine oxidase subunit alpha
MTNRVGHLDLEGRSVPVHDGDTVATALFRSGVRIFSRSFKYRRPRGLYCLTGDCPNCLVNVDGEPFVRACVTPAAPGQRVLRERGWPSADRDALGVLDRFHRLLPVGFYYKTLLRPRWLWPVVEPWARGLAGIGSIPADSSRTYREVRHLHPDLAVVGGGVAGLTAAIAAAEAGESVVLCDEGTIGKNVAGRSRRDSLDELAGRAGASERITVLERAPAVGVYEGPLVVVNEPSFLHLVHPRRVVIATGAVEEHGVFDGNDLPGVWLGRGAARLAGVYGLLPGRRVVVVGDGPEADEHAQTLREAGADVTFLREARVVAARGRRAVTQVELERDGARTSLPCDALVLSTQLVPRDGLLRQGNGLPVEGAGDAALPCTPTVRAPTSGIVCLCEDVGVDELEQAWHEGFRSTEILKRYTTATMGPCQGALCHWHLRAFVASKSDVSDRAASPTTARPPVRGLTLEEAASGVGHELDSRTSLHERHLALGATMEPAAPWRRPKHYGSMEEEYWAVRKAVSVMDVGTLGKFLVAGRDATEFLERLYPSHVGDLEPGRLRYALLLGEHGYVTDDGVVCALGDDRWYVTFTSSGAAATEATLRDWIETWQLDVRLVDMTAARGAINVAGPQARTLLQRLSDDALDNESFPYLRHREITVAGVPCRAIRLGFVGELSYELHHPSALSGGLWDALLAAGADLGIRPHGLDALRLLRLEKGHIIVGQDTDFDATPAKLNMPWAAKLEKPTFVGRTGLERSAAAETQRKLIAVAFGPEAPPEGAALTVDGRYVGNLTSSAYSPVLGHGVALGWVSRTDGSFPTTVEAGSATGTVVEHAFYDPAGELLRA